MKAVYLEWLDHAARGGWHGPASGPAPVLIRTLGIICEETRTHMVVADSLSEEGMARDPIAIMKNSIKKRRNMTIARSGIPKQISTPSGRRKPGKKITASPSGKKIVR